MAKTATKKKSTSAKKPEPFTKKRRLEKAPKAPTKTATARPKAAAKPKATAKATVAAKKTSKSTAKVKR